MGRKDLAVETDIVNLLKQLRAIWIILDTKLKLSDEQRQQVLKNQRRTLDADLEPENPDDPEDRQKTQSSFRRMITLQGDSSKVQAEKKPEKDQFATLDPISKNIKRFQRPFVASSL